MGNRSGDRRTPRPTRWMCERLLGGLAALDGAVREAKSSGVQGAHAVLDRLNALDGAVREAKSAGEQNDDAIRDDVRVVGDKVGQQSNAQDQIRISTEEITNRLGAIEETLDSAQEFLEGPKMGAPQPIPNEVQRDKKPGHATSSDKSTNELRECANWVLYYSDDLLLRICYAIRDIVIIWALFVLLPVLLYVFFSSGGKDFDFNQCVSIALELFVNPGGMPSHDGLPAFYGLTLQVIATGLVLEELLRPRDIIGFSRYAVICYRSKEDSDTATGRPSDVDGSDSSDDKKDVLRIRYFIKLPPGQQLYSVRVDVMAQTESQKRGEDANRPWQLRYSFPADEIKGVDECFGMRGVNYAEIALDDPYPLCGGLTLRKALGGEDGQKYISDMVVRVSGQTRFGQSVVAECTYPLKRILDGYNFKSVNSHDSTADNRDGAEQNRFSHLDYVYKSAGNVGNFVCSESKPDLGDEKGRGDSVTLRDRLFGCLCAGHSLPVMAMRILLFACLICEVVHALVRMVV